MTTLKNYLPQIITITIFTVLGIIIIQDAIINGTTL